MNTLSCRLLVLLLLVLPGRAAAVALQAPGVNAEHLASTCESTFDGITYCVEDDGDIHIVVIDLDDPYLRFDMVMADDVTSVDTTHRERIEEIVTRDPYQDQQVIVAINADYFGRSHGPEGLTVKNGRRLDADGGWSENPHAVWRSSLAISRLNQVSLGRKSIDELQDPRAYRERFFNAIGGGPLILNYGVVIPNAVACLLERFPIGACQRRIQTAAGLSEDGRWLSLAVGQGRDIEGFARLLRDYGAFTAIKLDGGGSSQLWYDGRMRHDTDRPVGNALLVIRSPIPAHAARLAGSSQVPVVEPGTPVEIRFEIQNTGYLDWEPDLGYRLKNVQGWPVLGPAYQRLAHPIPSSTGAVLSLSIRAPQRPGVYAAEWQLVRRAEPIGSRMWFDLVVIPPVNSDSTLKDEIAAQLDRWRARPQSELAENWPQLRRELERKIRFALEEELRAALLGPDGQVQLGEALLLRRWQEMPRPLPW